MAEPEHQPAMVTSLASAGARHITARCSQSMGMSQKAATPASSTVSVVITLATGDTAAKPEAPSWSWRRKAVTNTLPLFGLRIRVLVADTADVDLPTKDRGGYGKVICDRASRMRADTNVDTNAHSKRSRNAHRSRISLHILYQRKPGALYILCLAPLTTASEFHLYYDI
jgi:hypothetical protein